MFKVEILLTEENWILFKVEIEVTWKSWQFLSYVFLITLRKDRLLLMRVHSIHDWDATISGGTFNHLYCTLSCAN